MLLLAKLPDTLIEVSRLEKDESEPLPKAQEEVALVESALCCPLCSYSAQFDTHPEAGGAAEASVVGCRVPLHLFGRPCTPNQTQVSQTADEIHYCLPRHSMPRSLTHSLHNER